MRLKHGAKVRVTFTERGTGKFLKSDVVAPELLGAHLTVTSIMSGEPLRGVQYRVEGENPGDELVDDQLCDCARCIVTEVPA